MVIQAGEKLPDATLTETTEFGEACPVAPQKLSAAEQAKGKRVVIFGLPGAYTPTCSAKHLPGYVQNADKLKAKGIDQIVCLSVNDAFVMGAWGKDQKVGDKVLMVGDGDGAFAKATGLELALTGKGFGTRCQRFAKMHGSEWP